MSGNIWYWSFVGMAFVATMAAGLLLMKRTNRLAFSFLASSVLNVAILVAASVWWIAQTDDIFQRSTGIAFYGIAFVNVAAFDFFALASMRKQAESNPDDRRSQGADD